MTAVLVGAIIAGAQLVIEGAKYLVKKTKTKKDDAVVDFVVKHEAELLDQLQKLLEKHVASQPRPQTVDHRK